MRRQIIRLTESDLHNIIRTSVNRILEANGDGNNEKAWRKLAGKRIWQFFSNEDPQSKEGRKQLTQFKRNVKNAEDVKKKNKASKSKGEKEECVGESYIRNIVRNSVNKLIREEAEYVYGGDENDEEWSEAGLSPDDIVLIQSGEVAEFHQSDEGYEITYQGEEFGEAWLDDNGMYRANSEHDLFDGYLRTFEGATIDGLIEDILYKLSDAILNGNEDEYDDYGENEEDDLDDIYHNDDDDDVF